MTAARRRAVVAIDGPAGSGKSSTAQLVADELGFRHLDSGALYRAATWAALRSGEPQEGWTDKTILTAARTVRLRPAASSFVQVVSGDDATDAIRSAEVTSAVSRVARMPRVRQWVNAQLRQLALSSDVVVDGRDIGSTVFPDAALKIFLTADAEERARRRLRQRSGGGEPAADEVAAEARLITARDTRDAAQSGMALGAVVLDTTRLSEAQQVARIVALAKGVLAD